MKILYLNERAGSSPEFRYTVTKAVNTVIFSIGEIMSRAAASEYCSSPDWKIIITKTGV